MNSDELRALADRATPGPWRTEGFNNLDAIVPMVLAADGQNVTPALDFDQWGDARLIAALGPDAARLLADAMDALRRLKEGEWLDVDALLARFSALGKETE